MTLLVPDPRDQVLVEVLAQQRHDSVDVLALPGVDVFGEQLAL